MTNIEREKKGVIEKKERGRYSPAAVELITFPRGEQRGGIVREGSKWMLKKRPGALTQDTWEEIVVRKGDTY